MLHVIQRLFHQDFTKIFSNVCLHLEWYVFMSFFIRSCLWCILNKLQVIEFFLFIGKCCWSIFWLILRDRNVNHDLWISDFKGFLRSIQQTYYIKGFQLDNLTLYTYPPVIPWGERVQHKYRKKCKLAYRIQYDT